MQGQKKKTFFILLGKHISAMSPDREMDVLDSGKGAMLSERGPWAGMGNQEKGSTRYHAVPNKSVPPL